MSEAREEQEHESCCYICGKKMEPPYSDGRCYDCYTEAAREDCFEDYDPRNRDR